MEEMQLATNDSIEILKGKLHFVVSDDICKPQFQNTQKSVYFCTDNTLIYTAFFADFGPVDLGLTYTFCQEIQELLRTAVTAKKNVVYYCANHPHKRANSAVLLCAYLIFVLEQTAEEAYSHFYGINPPLCPYRDAAFSINTFPVTVLDCARAMHRVRVLGHFSYKDFCLPTFRRLVQLEHGDISWIVPNKFIAFSGPINKRRLIRPGVSTLLPEEYVPLFKALGVTCVVRFNSKCYDRNVFLTAKIRHADLFYEDGSNPPEGILQSFLQLCENEKGAIAVHCKAGLGRTGTNIAAYMMKHYGYSARETIAWCRICRPGSVVGPQQQYLMSIESRMKAEGELFRSKFPGHSAGHTPIPMNFSTGVSGRSSNANDKIDNVNDDDDCSDKDSNNDNGNETSSNTDDNNDNCKEDGNKINNVQDGKKVHNVQDSNSSNNSNNGNSSKIEKGGKKNDSTVTWTLPSSTVSNTKSQDGDNCVPGLFKTNQVNNSTSANQISGRDQQQSSLIDSSKHLKNATLSSIETLPSTQNKNTSSSTSTTASSSISSSTSTLKSMCVSLSSCSSSSSSSSSSSGKVVHSSVQGGANTNTNTNTNTHSNNTSNNNNSNNNNNYKQSNTRLRKISTNTNTNTNTSISVPMILSKTTQATSQKDGMQDNSNGNNNTMNFHLAKSSTRPNTSGGSTNSNSNSGLSSGSALGNVSVGGLGGMSIKAGGPGSGIGSGGTLSMSMSAHTGMTIATPTGHRKRQQDLQAEIEQQQQQLRKQSTTATPRPSTTITANTANASSLSRIGNGNGTGTRTRLGGS